MSKVCGDSEKGKRVADVRRYLGMSQSEFSTRLGLSRSYLGQVEIGIASLGSRATSDLCRLFNVNEKWIESGEGDMFVPRKKEEALAGLFSDVLRGSSFKARLISGLAALSEDDWQQLEKIVDKFIEGNEE